MRLLFDENIAPFYREQLAARLPDLALLRVGDANAPSFGTSDPVLLRWCEANDCILVTADRATMPDHFARHTSRGKHLPGLLVVRPRAKVSEVLEAVELIVRLAAPEELKDQYLYIPL